MFLLSKIFWLLAAPDNLAVVLLVLGGLLAARGKRLGRRLLVVVTLFFLAVWLLPMDEWLLQPLENRFPLAQKPPERVDGVLVLGGAGVVRVSVERKTVAVNEAAERIFAAMAMMRRYPNARVVYSGGSGVPYYQEFKEAETLKPLFDDLGFEHANITFESESRNTFDNVQLCRQLMLPQPHETWLLITSASHMPRAVGIMRKVGWEGKVVPWPVDYRSAGVVSWNPFLDGFARKLYAVSAAAREWAGLAAYYLLHRTDAWFPRPEPARA